MIGGDRAAAAARSLEGSSAPRPLVVDLEEARRADHEPAGPELHFRSPEEIRQETAQEPPFVWDGYLAPGAVTLLAGKPKGGKSTLAFAIAEAMVTGETAFLGRPIDPGPVVYVSEEGDATVRPKLPPDGTALRTLTRGGAWPRPSWPKLIDGAATEAVRVGAQLLVIDTLSFWSDLKADQEKDAGATQVAMEALLAAANLGVAVLLVHHQRKAGGEEGDAVRGSGAITGAVEAIVELERFSEAPAGQRRLVTLARWSAPGMLLIERNQATGEWRAIAEGADRDDARKAGWRDQLLRAIPTEQPGAAYSELTEALGAEKPKWYPALADLIGDNLVHRCGAGVKGNPYRFFRAQSQAVPGNRPDAKDTKDGKGPEVDSVPAVLPRRGTAKELNRKQNPSTPSEDAIPATPEQDAEAERLQAKFGGDG